jgi:SecD/SecF fusion protein
VLIYERLREERDRGASLALAIRNGYDRAFPTILDTHLTSIFTAIVLYVVGNDQLKGFGITLTVGLIISLFTSLYMTRTLFEIWLYKGWLKKLSFFGGLVRLVHLKYWDFMSIRYYWFTATITLTILGAALFIWRADTNAAPGGTPTVLNIDFTGGTAYTGRLTEPMSLEQLRKYLGDPNDPELKAQLEGANNPMPDLSIEQLFSGSETPGEGKSSYFTVRTSNKDSLGVLRYISQAMRDPDTGKSYLQLLKLSKIEMLDAEGKKGIVQGVRISFTNEAGEPDYASPAQVQRVIGREFEARGRSPSGFSIERPQDRKLERDGHFSQLTVRLADPMPRSELEHMIKDVQTTFANSPQPERLEVFDKQLAANTQERALYAILASWGAILLYLWFRFGNWTFGAATVLCLIHDLFFTLGVIASCYYLHYYLPGVASLLGIGDFKIDLPAVAALLTLVGYSVNDTIVVFDRIREVRGKNPLLTPQMINDGVNQTLTRTILASTTVFLVVLVLYIMGGEGVKLFAFVMIVGVVVGTYSSIYIASPLLLIFGEGRQRGAAQLVDRPPQVASRE